MRTISGLVLSLIATWAIAEDVTLTVATWGGAYEAVQRDVLFEPFTEATGIAIETRLYTGGLSVLETDPPDLVDMSMVEAIAACEAGQLKHLEYATLPAGADGTPAQQDFARGALRSCALAHTVYATVIAYNSRVFAGHRPRQVEDLFNLEEFPGPRGLQRSPYANLEWALMSYGVPRRELYSLLSTSRGLRLAFERLSRLSGRIRWWTRGETPVEWLESGEVVMASGYNGRFFSSAMERGSDIEILWDGQLQERQTWVIPESARHPDAAWRFIRFATTTDRMVDIANHIAYGPTRQSAADRIGTHPTTGVDMRPHIPTHPYNNASAIRKDVVWYARTYDRVRERFQSWLASFDTQSRP